MAIALSIFKIVKINEKIFLNPKKKKFSLEDFQSNLDSITDILGNPAPSTKFDRIWYDTNNNKAKYKIEHWTDTNDEIIRVFIDDIQEAVLYNRYKIPPNQTKRFTGGYQLKVDFNILIDFNDYEVFIFTNKKFSNQFIRRLKGVGGLEYEHIKFNLEEITKIANIQNVSTVWENESDVNVKKIGYIGVQVHKDKRIDLGRATAIRVELINNDKILPDVYISEDCRLSSLSKHVTSNDLVHVYKNLKSKLMISN